MNEYEVVVLIATILGIVVLILWIFLPFAVFGTKPLLEQILAEAKRNNELLSELGLKIDKLPRASGQDRDA